MSREVTERDFRADEFKDAKLEDYEFREDGKLVRKDRWRTAIYKIADALGVSVRGGFEISQVIAAAERVGCWSLVADEDYIPQGEKVDLMMPDGSVLIGCRLHAAGIWSWSLPGGGVETISDADASYWRPHTPEKEDE